MVAVVGFVQTMLVSSFPTSKPTRYVQERRWGTVADNRLVADCNTDDSIDLVHMLPLPDRSHPAPFGMAVDRQRTFRLAVFAVVAESYVAGTD